MWPKKHRSEQKKSYSYKRQTKGGEKKLDPIPLKTKKKV